MSNKGVVATAITPFRFYLNSMNQTSLSAVAEQEGAGMEPNAGKRIVSKGDYARLVGKHMMFQAYLIGAFFLIASIGLALLVCLAGFPSGLWHLDPYAAVGALIGSIVFGKLLAPSITLFNKVDAKVRRLEPLLNRTRPNSANLPARQSLVRASSEPPQAQEALLLRAAGEGQERHKEQLLRPTEEEAQQRYVVVVKDLDVRGDNDVQFFEMLFKTQNYSDRQINNLFTWALHLPFIEGHELRIPAGSQEMAETLARSCESMGGICTIQTVIKEAYEWLYEGIGGERQV